MTGYRSSPVDDEVMVGSKGSVSLRLLPASPTDEGPVRQRAERARSTFSALVGPECTDTARRAQVEHRRDPGRAGEARRRLRADGPERDPAARVKIRSSPCVVAVDEIVSREAELLGDSLSVSLAD